MFKRVSTALTTKFKTKKVPESETTGPVSKDNTAGWIKATCLDYPKVEGNLPGNTDDNIDVTYDTWHFKAVRTEDGGFDVTTGDKTIHTTEYTEFNYNDSYGNNYSGYADPTIK